MRSGFPGTLEALSDGDKASFKAQSPAWAWSQPCCVVYECASIRQTHHPINKTELSYTSVLVYARHTIQSTYSTCTLYTLCVYICACDHIIICVSCDIVGHVDKVPAYPAIRNRPC